jgi:hypothetical protein
MGVRVVISGARDSALFIERHFVITHQYEHEDRCVMSRRGLRAEQQSDGADAEWDYKLLLTPFR